MGKVIHLQGKKEFPDLDVLMGCFHEDFDLYGNTLEEVVNVFKKGAAGEAGRLQRVQSDVARFMAARPDDRHLESDLEEFFWPGVSPQGWEPGITNWRQWLTRVAELLVETPHAIHR